VPKIQLALLLASIAYFSTVGAGLSALYGGLISLVNTALVNESNFMELCFILPTLKYNNMLIDLTINTIRSII
jgi:hypothetical protein